MDKVDFIKKGSACYYSFDRACILDCGVDTDRNLRILEFVEERQCTVTVMGLILREKYRFESDLYLNHHPAIRFAYGNSCKEIDFESEHKSDLQAVNDTFNSLQSKGKIIYNSTLDLTKYHTRSAMNLLIYALLPELSGYNPLAWIMN